MTTDTPTPSTQLHALFQLSDRVVPGGFAWPDCLRQNSRDSYSYIYARSFEFDGSVSEHSCHIEPHHALAIVERAAEDWLLKVPNEIAWCPREQAYISLFHGNDVFYDSLPAALAAENGRGG